MKIHVIIYRSIFFIAMFLVLSCADKSDKDVPDINKEGVEIKTMTYNIYSGQLKGISAIADVINRANPDIVGLQEVETGTNNLPQDVAAQFIAETDMKYAYFVKTYDYNGGAYGNLILSKYPISEEVTYDLGVVVTVGSYPRALGLVKVEKEGKEFYFGVTHLDHLADETNKMHQIEGILNLVEEIKQPFILAGDFNALVGSTPMNTLLTKFQLGCLRGNCGFTTGVPTPSKAIDFIMYAPSHLMEPIAYNVFYDAYLESDHFPVIATFNIYK